MPIYKETKNMILGEFVAQRIANIYVTKIGIGDPVQEIPGFLKNNEYGFTITNEDCPHKVYYDKEKSKTFSYTSKLKYYYYFKFSESLLFYSSFYSTSKGLKIENFTIYSYDGLRGPHCFHIGTQIIAELDDKETSLIDGLHKKECIQSYFYEYKIYKEDEMYLILDLNDDFENENKYKFIKPILLSFNVQTINLKWGLTFKKLNINNYNITFDKQIRAEFDINFGCFLGKSDFNEYFKKYLINNNIYVEPKIYEKKYLIYFFEKGMKGFDKIKNISLVFYHKELNYNFTLNYQDLILEKNNGYFFLIVFEYQAYWNEWIFGFPFFKKYSFVFNHDSKLIGFKCPNGCTINENESNTNKIIEDINNIKYNDIKNIFNTRDNNNKTSEIYKKNQIKVNENDNKDFGFKVIIIIFLGIIFIVAVIFFLDFLLEKKYLKSERLK